MLERSLAEVRDMSPDAESLKRLATVHNEIEHQLSQAVTDELKVELNEFSSCCRDNPHPSKPQIRVAQAQLIGWIEGLLHGVQLSFAAHGASTSTHDDGQVDVDDPDWIHPGYV
jgi:hypothetical protein